MNKSEIQYKPEGGCHIDKACKEAVALAEKENRDVVFKFNEVEIVATPWSGWETLAKFYDAETERLRDEYRRSPEGIAAAKKRESEVDAKQHAVTDLLNRLPVTLGSGSLDKAIVWLKRFTSSADDIGVKFDHRSVAETFISYGFKENYGVGQSPEWFNTRERMGRYIIGQAINCLKIGLPPHGVTFSFIEKYEALPK